MFLDKLANNMAADNMVPCVAKTSAAMSLTVQSDRALPSMSHYFK